MNFKTFVKNFLARTFESLKMKDSSAIAINDLLSPPEAVRGMTKWQPELFEKVVKLPHVETPAHNISVKKAGKVLQGLKLKIPNFKPIQDCSSNKENKIVVLDPAAFETLSGEDKDTLVKDYNCSFGESTYTLTYANYPSSKSLEAILPKGSETLSSSTIVGHITYVNLNHDYLMPYKEIIGQLILSTTKAELVVTKTNSIENKFRNLDLEILAGDPKLGFEVTVKENGCSFKLDFSKVYWNPRLSTEHQRIVDMVNYGDTVFDVFGGVGPFSVPIGVKGKLTKKQPIPIYVHANDLNPSSFEYLQKNVILNKIKDHFHSYNLDGGEFIRTVVKKGIEEYYESQENKGQIHILMNLPALATTFLGNFRGLISQEQCAKWNSLPNKKLPYVHVYAFSKDDDKDTDLTKECCDQLSVEEIAGLKLNFVRDVGPKKDMYRVTFPLTLEILSKGVDNDGTGQDRKRIKLSE